MGELHEFASVGKDAEEQREQWMRIISQAVSALTRSLFPPHVISANPLPHVDATQLRIFAGYLLLCEASDCVSLPYCELRSYFHGEASLAVYSDELCQFVVGVLPIKEDAFVRSYLGNIFRFGNLRFCARTSEETELWMRVLMNVKTKLRYGAPDPSADDLAVFREAISQRVGELPGVPKKAAHHLHVDAMLPLKPRKPIQTAFVLDNSPNSINLIFHI